MKYTTEELINFGIDGFHERRQYDILLLSEKRPWHVCHSTKCSFGTNYIRRQREPIITMTPQGRYAISNHRSFESLFNRLCGLTSKKRQGPHYRPPVRWIHRWPMNSPHKVPATRKKLPFDDVIISWINHLPPACWSTFWKSIFKHQLGCRFDILESISFFCILAYAIIYVLIHHIISWLYLYFLNILNFFQVLLY